jgi:peptidoglycan/xylan/chitin deacetylase (PgdA/CDA1 family)
MITSRADGRVTTLCFHGIGAPERDLEDGEQRFWISEQCFTEMLDLLADHPDVGITFDDANSSDHRYALPALARRGQVATFFVIAGRLDRPGSLDSDQLRELARAGMIIGSHGMDHVSWRTLPDESARRREFTEAAVRIQEITGEAVSQAACPNGQYDRRVLRGLRANGYQRVYTVDGGASRPTAWVRDRYTVTRHDTVDTLADYLDAPDGGARSRVTREARGMIKRWR